MNQPSTIASITRPTLLISAPASGQGKTVVTAALAYYYRCRGQRVRVLKCGPDFLDPQIHTLASGAPVHTVDLAMGGEDDARYRLAEAAQQADVLLIEGVMGLYDGTPSSAHIAAHFGLPVLVVIDAKAMAQTFGAIAYGLATYQDGVHVTGVLANRVGSAYHAELLRAALPDTLTWYGALPPDPAAALPERHLGLLQAAEITDLEARLARLADHLLHSTMSLPRATFALPEPPALTPRLAHKTIAIARDTAFSFIYPANIDILQRLGAQIKFFSPINGDTLPDCDALWLPGGYPELHIESLSQRCRPLWAALQAHLRAQKPILAECGGMMALFETLVDQNGQVHPMAGLLPGRTVMQPRLTALGVQQVHLPEGELRGHTFHYSRCETALTPVAKATACNHRGHGGEAVYRIHRLTASYVHFYFPSNPAAVAALFSS